MAAAIFTSYRRSDSAAFAGRIADFLTYRYPDVPVFFDTASIDPGADFLEVITSRLRSSEVVLAIIGETWLTCVNEAGRRRIDDPKDFVRLELSTALALKSRVIPVLLDNARMPAPDQLPKDLRPLATRNAEFIRNVTFTRDINHLADSIYSYIAASNKPPMSAPNNINRSDSMVRRQLIRAIEDYRDKTPRQNYLILTNKLKQFVQFARNDDGTVLFDLPTQALTPLQIIAAQRFFSESYTASQKPLDDKNFSFEIDSLPLEPIFISQLIMETFEHVYGTAPNEPLEISMFAS
jgi:hypothetical protein